MVRPQACEYAQQRGFADAAAPFQQQPFGRAGFKADGLEHHAACGGVDGGLVEHKHGAVFRLHWAFQAAFDAVCTLLPLLRWRGGGNGLTVGTSVFRLPLHPIQSSLKPAQAFHHRRPFNQPAVGIGEPAEAVLHAGKRCARLHHVAESERFGEVHRQRDDDGDENADCAHTPPKRFLGGTRSW